MTRSQLLFDAAVSAVFQLSGNGCDAQTQSSKEPTSAGNGL